MTHEIGRSIGEAAPALHWASRPGQGMSAVDTWLFPLLFPPDTFLLGPRDKLSHVPCLHVCSVWGCSPRRAKAEPTRQQVTLSTLIIHVCTYCTCVHIQTRQLDATALHQRNTQKQPLPTCRSTCTHEHMHTHRSVHIGEPHTGSVMASATVLSLLSSLQTPTSH